MKLSKLRRKIKRYARYDYFINRTMTRGEYAKVMIVADNDASLVMLLVRIDEAKLDPWKHPSRLISGDGTSFFANLWDWFLENWPTILRIILTIAPLLLMETDKHEDS
jgi:hypothetical protein